MRLKFGQLPMLVAILAGAVGGIRIAHAAGESAEDSGTLTTDFHDRVTALEADMGPGSGWEFPFGEPRSADLNPQELNIVLSLRRLVLNDEDEELGSLADQVERRQEEMPVQMLFWLAYAQSRLHQNLACLTNLKLLLLIQNDWGHLDYGQQAWVLTGTPDLLFLLGKRELAASLYARLAASSVAQLELWGHYQLAGMDFLERDFKQAALKYSTVCEADKPGLWREHACAMAEIAGRLSRLGREGEPHGAVAYVNP